MAERKITFEEYTKFLEETLAAFQTYWGENSMTHPEYFPEQMYFEEWNEQYAAWRESVCELMPDEVPE